MVTAVITKARSTSGIAISWGAEHRTGYCEKCSTLLEQDPQVTDKVRLNLCRKCNGYRKGQLVSRQMSVEEPAPLNCIRLSCIWKFVFDMVTYSLILLYHQKRVEYAESNRHKKILERYRTGEKSPTNLIEAVIANMKLACPICRKVETKW